MPGGRTSHITFWLERFVLQLWDLWEEELMVQVALPEGATITLARNTQRLLLCIFSILLPFSQHFLFQLTASHFLPFPLSVSCLLAGLQGAVSLSPRHNWYWLQRGVTPAKASWLVTHEGSLYSTKTLKVIYKCHKAMCSIGVITVKMQCKLAAAWILFWQMLFVSNTLHLSIMRENRLLD